MFTESLHCLLVSCLLSINDEQQQQQQPGVFSVERTEDQRAAVNTGVRREVDVATNRLWQRKQFSHSHFSSTKQRTPEHTTDD